MEISWIWIACANAVLWLAGLGVAIAIRRAGAQRKWQDQFAQFGDAVRSVELTNSAYFRSLEQMLKNLEFVRCSMEQAEQRLSGIVSRSGRDRDGRHETAALLLSAGEKPAKIAAMLNLPLNQVKRAREPQRPAPKGRKTQVQKSATGQAPAMRKDRMSLWSARVKKMFPQALSSGNGGGDNDAENGSSNLNAGGGA